MFVIFVYDENQNLISWADCLFASTFCWAAGHFQTFRINYIFHPLCLYRITMDTL
ncbi:hypothetical protein Hanom_Chr10g00914111 [Helianthus anomalus]